MEKKIYKLGDCIARQDEKGAVFIRAASSKRSTKYDYDKYGISCSDAPATACDLQGEMDKKDFGQIASIYNYYQRLGATPRLYGGYYSNKHFVL